MVGTCLPRPRGGTTSVRPFNRFASSSALVLAALVGCNIHSGSGLDPDELVEGGASGNNSGSGGGSGGSSGGSGPGFDSGINSSGSSGSSSGGGGPSCSTMAASACLGCCQGQFPGGMSYENALQSCLCGGSSCASACAGEVCAGQPFSSASSACQQCAAGTACYPQIEQNCNSDPSCQMFQACTSTCPNNGTGSSSGSSSGGGDGADAGSPLDSGPSSCASNPSNCIECCGTQDPSGYQIFLNDVGQCICTGSAPCASSCANEFCAGKPFSSQNDPCQMCVQQNTAMGTTCYSQVKQECTSNATCQPFAACYLGCPPGSN
jgi:hypothetical protein